MAKGITREERRKALKEDYNNRGRSDRNWYVMDSKVLEEEFGIKSFTPKEGQVFLHLLERWEDKKFFLELFVHYNMGADNHAFLCLDKMYGETCPICAYREELKNANEPKDVYNQFNWTRRYLMWVVNMETKRTVKEGPMLYDAPTKVKNEILGLCLDPRTDEIVDPSDPQERINVVFKRTGKTMTNTEYTQFKLEEQEDDIPEEFLDLPEMRKIIIKPELSEIRKVLGMKTRDSKEDAEEEETRTERKGKYKNRPSEKEEEVEEDSEPIRKTKLHPRDKSKDEDERPIRKLKHRGEEEETEEEVEEDEINGEPGDDVPFERKKYSSRREEVDEEDDEKKEKREVINTTRKRMNRDR